MTRRLSSAVLLGLLGTTMCWAQTTPYELKVESGSGLLAFTFKTTRTQARAYLPDDLAPGEPFTATIEGPSNYTLEFAGQSVRANQGLVHWQVPVSSTNDADPSYALILRDGRGVEVARAAVLGMTTKTIQAAGLLHARQFHLPRFIQAGAPAPALGPFDGDAETTRIVIGGKSARIVAESPRKAILLCPDVLGEVNYQIAKGETRLEGPVRSLRLEVKPAGMVVSGLTGLQEDIPFTRGNQYLFLRAANVTADGTYQSRRNEEDPADDAQPQPLRLVFPQTPIDDVALILHGARKEQAAKLRALEFDPLPVLAVFLDDPDLGGDAAYAMLAVDSAAGQKQALTILFQAMPSAGPNIQRIGLGWFLEHYAPEASAEMHAVAHAAARRILARPQTSRTDAIELALYVIGYTGDHDDFAVLEKNYEYRNGWPGLKRVQDASESALARLGSREHAAQIRAELDLPFLHTPDDAIRLGHSLQKAGFSGLPEFLPAICPHLNDAAVIDIDVTWDPKFSAMSALNAIANHSSPLALPAMKTVDEWKRFCAVR